MAQNLKPIEEMKYPKAIRRREDVAEFVEFSQTQTLEEIKASRLWETYKKLVDDNGEPTFSTYTRLPYGHTARLHYHRFSIVVTLFEGEEGSGDYLVYNVYKSIYARSLNVTV